MSTRANIILHSQAGDIYLYHHHDGYPQGVGVQLQKVMAKLSDHAKREPWSIVWTANELIKNQCGLNDDEYELTTGLHGDIEYCYVLNFKAGTLRCYERDYGESCDRDKVCRRENLCTIPEWDGGKTIYEKD